MNEGEALHCAVTKGWVGAPRPASYNQLSVLILTQVNVVQHMLQREPMGAQKMDRNNRLGVQVF